MLGLRGMILGLAIWLFTTVFGEAQTIIELPFEKPDESEIRWTKPQKEYFAPQWQSRAIANVSSPSLEVYLPPENIRNGTSVIIAPGGGLYALSIESEGRGVAKWLNDHGIAAFVLRYRLVPTDVDAIKELVEICATDNDARLRKTRKVLKYSIQDGLAAVKHVREQATEYQLSPDKIGFMGFSGGGCVLLGMVNEAAIDDAPNFLVAGYPGTDLVWPIPGVKTPPTLFVAASDDQVVASTEVITLYQHWRKVGAKAGLILYPDGGHGFATQTQNKFSDRWLEHFRQWATSEGLIQSL